VGEWKSNAPDGQQIHLEGSPHSREAQVHTLNDPLPFSSPVLYYPYFAVLSLLQTSLETKIERQHERNETKRRRNISAKWRRTGRQTNKEGKKLNDTKIKQ
jgi:hypothetical protein